MNEFIEDLVNILQLLNNEFNNSGGIGGGGLSAPATEQIQNFLNKYTDIPLSSFIYDPDDPPPLPDYDRLLVMRKNN